MTQSTGSPGRRFSLSRRGTAVLACVVAGAAAVLTANARPAHAVGGAANLVVTEIAYGGLASGAHAYSGDTGDGEYVELTNIGGAAQDVSGWFFDTSASTTIATPSPTVGTSLAGLATGSGTNSVIQPGESVIITDLTPADFRTEWGLKSTVKVINDGTTTLKSSGSVYISNGTAVLDQISYNLSAASAGKGKSAFVSAAHVADQQAAGGSTFASLPSNGWTLSTVADSEGSWTSAAGAVGSPAASTLGTSTPASVRTAGVTVSGGSNQTATVGTAFSFTGLSASGGTGSYTWSAPALSGTGLSINPSTGAITGTPTAVGTINVTATATDTASSSGSTAFTITVGSGVDPNYANIVINEITSDNSDNTELTSKLPPALYTALNTSPNSASDLVELYNKGTQAVDITGWKQSDSHGAASATVFAGRVFNVGGNTITSIPAHGFGVFQSGQGLGSGGDAVQIYLPDGTLVDSVTFGAAQAGYDESVDPSNSGPTGAEVYHALARCPDGGGAVNTNSNDATTSWFSVKVASFGSSNNSSCDDSTDPNNAVKYFNEQPPTGLPGSCTPSAPSGSNSVAVPDAVAWPTTDGVSTVDNQCEFVTAQDPTGNDMSSLVFSADGSVLWGAQNKNHVWKLVKDPSTGKFLPATDNGWSNGKAITFTGTDPNASQPDDEGLTVGGNGNLFVTSERDNANSNVSKDEVLEYDPTAAGTTLAPVQQWDLTSEFVPSVIAATGNDANLGFEGVTYVPDSFLTSHGFHDQHLNKTYDPADYPGHGSGLFFLAMEKDGHVYAYALNSDGTYQRVADIDTGIDGTSAIADVQFNADDEGIWTDCDNDCGVVDSLLRINASGNFTRVVSYNRPAGLPNDNLEGFAIAPASTATGGKRQVVWSDDGIYGEGNAWNSDHTANAPSPDWGHALYSGTLPATAAPTYLFVNENPDGPNQVENYRVNADGTTTLVGTYPTGHPGSNETWIAGERAAWVPATNHLYALNLGDQTVSVFAVDPSSGVLTLQSTTGYLDAVSIAVNPAGTVLYAGGSTNESSANQLTSYSINSDGSINPGPVQTVAADVDGLTVSPDGTKVAAAYPGYGPIDSSVQVWSTDSQGDLTPLTTIDEPRPTDVRFTSNNTLVSASTFPNDLDAFTLGSGKLTNTASTPTLSQTLAVGPDGAVYFNTPTGLQGTDSAALTPGTTTAYPTDQSITSMTVTPDGSRLFASSASGTEIDDYAIGADHGLTPQAQIPVPAGLIPTVIAYTPTTPAGAGNSTMAAPVTKSGPSRAAQRRRFFTVDAMPRTSRSSPNSKRWSPSPSVSGPARANRWGNRSCGSEAKNPLSSRWNSSEAWGSLWSKADSRLSS